MIFESCNFFVYMRKGVACTEAYYLINAVMDIIIHMVIMKDDDIEYSRLSY